MSRVARIAWAALWLNVLVILWGAFVRATGSGAGCGEHWPLCNGEVLPRSPRTDTVVEFVHRVTSGMALLAVGWLTYAAFRVKPRVASLRRAAAASMALIVSEAAVGAGLVLFRLVADNDSMARALFMGVHLVNTFLLLGALTLAAHAASGGAALGIRARPLLSTLFLVVLSALTVAGASGAVAALGDTLYPSRSLGEALAQDLSSTSHILIRLRILHPALAIASGVANIAVCRLAARTTPDATTTRLVMIVEGLVAAQVAAGFANVLLLAPVWMQIVHLLLADLLWISLVLTAARTLRVADRTAPATSYPGMSPVAGRVSP